MPGYNIASFSYFTDAQILQMLSNVIALVVADPLNYDKSWGAEGKTGTLGRESTNGDMLNTLMEVLHRRDPKKYPVTQPDRAGTALRRDYRDFEWPDWLNQQNLPPCP